jgi:hypothetical protein
MMLLEKKSNKIIRPSHIKQIAAALSDTIDLKKSKNHSINEKTVIDIFQTGLGLNLSKGEIIENNSAIKHYTISCNEGGFLTYPVADEIAKIIRQLENYRGEYEITEKRNNLFHIQFKKGCRRV